MKHETFKDLTEKELHHRLAKEREILLNLQREKKLGILSKPHLIKKTKKNIARILTELNKRRIEKSKQNLK